MEVLVSLPSAMDFNFDSNCSTPYISAPSSPKLFGEIYYSAPASPTRSSALFRDFNNISFVQRSRISFDSSPFEVKQNSTSGDTRVDEEENDFAFDFSGQFDKASLTAEELFDGGKIKSLRPPPCLQFSDSAFPPKSPKREKQAESFDKSLEEEQVREGLSFSSSKSKNRSTRSLSDFVFEEEEQEQSTEPTSSNSKSSSFFGKWRFKDFLLFRSASEGRVTRKDPLKKFTALSKKHHEYKNSSFRSNDGSVSGSSTGSSKRRTPVSAHEEHYTSNRTVHDELKRKTYLPYKTGLLGCVGFEFDPTVDGLTKDLVSIKRG